MSSETYKTSDLKERFQQLYPWVMYGQNENEFTQLLKEMVDKEDLSGFYFIFSSLHEIGTHASLSPSSQLSRFFHLLTETGQDYAQKYAKLLSRMIDPDNLPEMSMEDLNELLWANIFVPSSQNKREGRKDLFSSATKILSSKEWSEKLDEEVQAVLVKILVANQTDRSLEDFWWAMLTEMPSETNLNTGKIKDAFYLGAMGLTHMPDLEGDLDSLPSDLIPKVFDLLVKKMEEKGERDASLLKLWLHSLAGDYSLESVADAIKKFDKGAWPSWAKNGLEDFSKNKEKFISEEED